MLLQSVVCVEPAIRGYQSATRYRSGARDGGAAAVKQPAKANRSADSRNAPRRTVSPVSHTILTQISFIPAMDLVPDFRLLLLL